MHSSCDAISSEARIDGSFAWSSGAPPKAPRACTLGSESDPCIALVLCLRLKFSTLIFNCIETTEIQFLHHTVICNPDTPQTSISVLIFTFEIMTGRGGGGGRRVLLPPM